MEWVVQKQGSNVYHCLGMLWQGKGKMILRKHLALAAFSPPCLSCLAPQEQHSPRAQPRLESVHSPVESTPCSLLKPMQRPESQLPVRTAVFPPASPLSDRPARVEHSWRELRSSTPHSVEPPKEGITWHPAETSRLLLAPRSPSGLEGTVNFILSIGKKGEKKKVQPVASSGWPGEDTLQTVRGA